MKIKLIDKRNKKFVIHLPFWFFRFLKHTDEWNLSKDEFNRLYKTLKAFKKTHPNFVFLEVRSPDGGYISITL